MTQLDGQPDSRTVRVPRRRSQDDWYVPRDRRTGVGIARAVLVVVSVMSMAAAAGYLLAGGRVPWGQSDSSVQPPPTVVAQAPAAVPTTPTSAPPKPANVEPTAIPIVTVPPATAAPPTLAPPPALAKPTSPPAAAKPTVEQRKAQIERTIQGYFEALRAEDYARAQQVCCTPEWRSQYPVDTWKNNFKGVTDLYLSGAPRYQRVDDDVVVVDTDYTFRSGGAQRCFVLHWTFKPVGSEWKADIAAATPCQGR